MIYQMKTNGKSQEGLTEASGLRLAENVKNILLLLSVLFEWGH